MLNLVTQFDAHRINGVQGLGYDPVAEQVLLYRRQENQVISYSLSGEGLHSYTPPGVGSYYLDLDIVDAPLRLAGRDVPAGVALIFASGVQGNGPSIAAFDTATETTLATLYVQVAGGELVGGAYDLERGTFFLVSKDFTAKASRITEVDATTGVALNAFDVPGFSGGDVEINPATGDLMFVSGFISGVGDTLLHMSKGGEFLGQEALPSNGGLTGLDFIPDSPADAYVVDLTGLVSRLSGTLGDAPVLGTAAGDRLDGTGAAETLAGLAGDDSIRTKGGGDFAYGGDGDDRLRGQGGTDYLDGGAGDDKLNADAGRDVLLGGRGVDVLEGGSGADRFVFATGDTGPTTQTADLILDFNRADHDKIDLSAIDALPGAPWGEAFRFIAATAFSNTAGELRYEWGHGRTLVMGDTNGDGAADFEIRLNGELALVKSDFLTGTRVTVPLSAPEPVTHASHVAYDPTPHLYLA